MVSCSAVASALVGGHGPAWLIKAIWAIVRDPTYDSFQKALLSSTALTMLLTFPVGTAYKLTKSRKLRDVLLAMVAFDVLAAMPIVGAVGFIHDSARPVRLGDPILGTLFCVLLGLVTWLVKCKPIPLGLPDDR